jgi:basic membrane lipoprotein Med (substrate-binding protein (PBP1-ABC) superfamily)
VDPEFRVITKYVGNWHDVVLARELAEALVAEGCTAIFQNADKAGLGVFQAAAAHPGVYAFGSNRNQNDLVPGAILASAVIDVPAAYLRVARAVKDRTYVPRAETVGAAEGVVNVELNQELVAGLSPEIAPWVAALVQRVRSGEVAAIPPAS